MAAIYLIRHGQASFGHTNYDQLSELGKLQATRLGQVLSTRLPQFDAVCLGTLKRHQQTAENCITEFGHNLADLQPRFDSGWNEYDHQNILARYRPEFVTAESMMEFIGAQENPQETLAEGFNGAIDRWIQAEDDTGYVESWGEFTARVHRALADTISEHSEAKNIAVFTSGGPISIVAQHLLGVGQDQIMRMNWTLMNCGVTKLVSTKSRLFVSSLNEHTHFEGQQNNHFITYT